MKKLVILGIVIGMVAFMSFGYQAHATDVGGIISADTTWTSAGSPYNIIADIQVADGVTLTIEPGVTVNNGQILVWGTIYAIGTNISKINLNNVTIREPNISDSKAKITIQHAIINGGCPFYGGFGGVTEERRFTLLDSEINNASYIFLDHPSNDCYIERNIFIDSGGIQIQYGNANVYIRNNVFFQQTTQWAILAYSNITNNNVIAEYNSFFSIDRIALRLEASGSIVATNNFWNTTDSTIIDTMVYDRNDDLGVNNYILYEPILTEPHPDTPIFTDNQAPTSVCGGDQVVFDEVTLDGSGSYDPDPNGSIVTYYWKIQQKMPPNNYIEAYGVNPTISGLTKGFYDMCLTVTDDQGATDIDCCLLAVAGSCSCTPSYIHIQSIIPTTIKGSKGQKFGKVTVIVNDDCGNPVSGVDVTGTFTGDYSDTLTGTTGSDGSIILTTSTETKRPSYEFCIDTLSHGTLAYISSYNVETCDGFSWK